MFPLLMHWRYCSLSKSGIWCKQVYESKAEKQFTCKIFIKSSWKKCIYKYPLLIGAILFKPECVVCVVVWAPFHWGFFHDNLNVKINILIEISFWSHSNFIKANAMHVCLAIPTNFCMCHDRTAVMTCWKICSDLAVRIWITAENFS